MIGIYHAHSGLRFLVLLAAVVATGYFVFAMATGRPVDKTVRILGSAFVGLLDLQVLLGLALLVIYLMGGRFYGALIGHVVLMVLAAVLAHVLLAMNRRRPTPGYALPLGAVLGALLLVVGGILALPGRGLFTMAPPT
jgi:hypothetical protein